MIDDDLDRALRVWADQELDRTPSTTLPDLSSVTRRRPRRVLAVAAAIIAVALVGVGTAIVANRHGTTASHAGNRGARSTSADDLVVHDGDTVTGTGVVIAVPGKPIRFCDPQVLQGDAGLQDLSVPCHSGITVIGVDLHRLTDRTIGHSNGAVSGVARLTGTYRHSTLTVTHQAEPIKAAPISFLDNVPCTAPAGGWPRGTKLQNLDLTAAEHYRHTHPGVVLHIAELRPTNQQVVAYVLTAGDPEPVERTLRPAFGQRLCVQKSRWTQGQLSHARKVLSSLFHQPPRGLSAPTLDMPDGLDSDGQIQMILAVPAVDTSLADRIDTTPPGLVDVQAWLVPRR